MHIIAGNSARSDVARMSPTGDAQRVAGGRAVLRGGENFTFALLLTVRCESGQRDGSALAVPDGGAFR
jgi:hypothetical protein